MKSVRIVKLIKTHKPYTNKTGSDGQGQTFLDDQNGDDVQGLRKSHQRRDRAKSRIPPTSVGGSLSSTQVTARPSGFFIHLYEMDDLLLGAQGSCLLVALGDVLKPMRQLRAKQAGCRRSQAFARSNSTTA